ncbi:lyase family protein [Arthrobacter sp. M4]|uniref:lyase family protein n=1 Tax=Arthrobacter sp. M4 TaxID=218160 RepID=UPI001CDC26C3|nr:lyase family protein [Arthrobacter sp. M4]MCA4133412.1 adenylosuccinate lyase family protein [Arthrobacter sp. M4]
MTPNDGDFGLLSPVSASPAVAALTGDRAVLAAILDVEAAWAGVLEDAGLAPAGSAAVVAEAADPGLFDVADIAERARGGGNPVIPLLADLRQQVRAVNVAAAGAVHNSLTSQDVLDTALMLLARRTVTAVLAEVRGTTAALAALASEHTATLCVSRSLTQHALPYTFGLRAAQWFQGIAAAAERLAAVTFPVQFGGAGGTLASATVLTADADADPFTLADALAERLHLSAATAPWHTNRLPFTALGDALAALSDSFGKIAADVLFLSRPEVGEVAEPRAEGRGVSSAMPQKQNPVLSVLVRSAAFQAPSLGAQLHLAAATFNDERPDGAWHSEWPALRSLLGLVLGASIQLRELAEGLQVFPEAMRRNLDLAGPLLLSERVSTVATPLLAGESGDKTAAKARLQEVVDRTLATPAGQQADTYAKLLREAIPADRLSDDELAELLDPAAYIGQATEIVKRILAAYPDYTHPKGAHRG